MLIGLEGGIGLYVELTVFSLRAEQQDKTEICCRRAVVAVVGAQVKGKDSPKREPAINKLCRDRNCAEWQGPATRPAAMLAHTLNDRRRLQALRS